RHTTLQAFEHGDVPFEKLVEALNPPRSLAHSPVVQVFFALHNQPRQPLVLAGVDVTAETVASDTAKFDLNLHAAEEGGELALALAWRTGLYGADVIHGLLDHFTDLLQAAAAAPDRPLEELLRTVPAPSPQRPPPALALISVPSPVPTPDEGESGDSPTILLLQDLWAALLGRDDLGPDDDFFAAGGHSLMGTRLIAAIAARFGVELPLVSVFEAPTVRALARRVEERLRAAAPKPTAIRRLPRRPDRGDVR
ncbi:MAG: phosphopantetheine-binding protein, partial [Gammaproteobacteria bacterium]